MNTAPTDGDLAARLEKLEQQVVQLTRERDEWAAKWQRMNRKYAELRWPGLTRIITGKGAHGVQVSTPQEPSPSQSGERRTGVGG